MQHSQIVWAARIIKETHPRIKEQLFHNQIVIHKMENMFKELPSKTSPPENTSFIIMHVSFLCPFA